MILVTVGIHAAYLYIGVIVMVYAVLAIAAILYFKETKNVDLVKYEK